MINLELVRNIRDIDNIKINMLENITNIYKGLEDTDINMKELLNENINLTKQLAQKLEIDLEREI